MRRWAALLCALPLVLLLDGCVAAVMTGHGGGRRPEAQRLDQRLTARVTAALVEAPDVAALDIRVSTYRAVVHLGGTVPSARARTRAVLLAREVEGVAYVVDELRVVAPRTPTEPLRGR